MCLVSFAKTSNYSALKKLQSKNMPAWGYIVICDDCSHKCSWCYGEFNHDLHHLMSFDHFKIILAKLKEMGTLQISLAGGEPTEHPQFKQFVAYANQQGFLIHVVSHGEHIDAELAQYLKEQNVDQVQINWQGRRNHDRIHGVSGSYEKARDAFRYLAQMGIETTANITVGKYNLPHIDEIMKEAVDLNVTRLRVWETTGYGTPYLKGLEAKSIFDACRAAAKRLGYGHCLSYDPAYEGDVSVACLQFSNLFMYINSHAKLEFCGAVANTVEFSDFLDPHLNGNDIREIYFKKNKEILGDNQAYCVARAGFNRQGLNLTPVKWVKRVERKELSTSSSL